MEPRQSSDFPDSFARVTVKGLYFKDGKILLSRDAVAVSKGGGEVLELPGGGWDFGEDFATTLKREIKEEMGLEVTSISNKPLFVYPVKKEDSHGFEWYWALMLIFAVEFKDLNFTPSVECKELVFLDYDEFMTVENLFVATQPLRNLLTREDFK